MKKHCTLFASVTASLTFLFSAGTVSGLEVGEKAAPLISVNWIQGEGPVWTETVATPEQTQYFAINFLPGTIAGDVASLKICEELCRRYNGRVKFFGILGHETMSNEDKETYKAISIPVGLDPKFTQTGAFLPVESVPLPFVALLGSDGKFLWRGDLMEFNAVLKEVLDQEFDFKTAELRNGFFRRIDNAVQKQDYDAALTVLSEALGKFPNDEQFVAFKAFVLAEFKADRPQALAMIDEALKAQPENLNFYNLKLRLLNSTEDAAEQDKTYDAMIQKFGSDSHMMYNLARKLLMPDDDSEMRLELGIKAARKAYEHFDEFEFAARSLALELMGDAFVRAGRLDLAVPALEEAYHLGAPVRDVKLCQAKLEKCRKNYAVGNTLPPNAEWIKKGK